MGVAQQNQVPQHGWGLSGSFKIPRKGVQNPLIETQWVEHQLRAPIFAVAWSQTSMFSWLRDFSKMARASLGAGGGRIKERLGPQGIHLGALMAEFPGGKREETQMMEFKATRHYP